MSKFSQVCVWAATLVKPEEVPAVVAFFKDEFNVRVKYLETVVTLAGQGGEGGRHDVFLAVHEDDIPKFAVPKLTVGVRWWEDVLNNGEGSIYPSDIREKYPKTW
jgi:hypothetical protein